MQREFFGLAILALGLSAATLVQFRFDAIPTGAPNTGPGNYTLRDRWTGTVWYCTPAGCVLTKTAVIKIIQ